MKLFSRLLLTAALAVPASASQAQVPPMMPEVPVPSGQLPGAPGPGSPQGQGRGPGPQVGGSPGSQPGMPSGAQSGMPPGAQPGMPPPQVVSPVLPPMSLSRQFAGPLPETAIQRFVDPETGVLCYLYTPYRVPHERNESGVLIYGANTIGSISCVQPGAAAQRAVPGAEPMSALPGGQSSASAVSPPPGNPASSGNPASASNPVNLGNSTQLGNSPGSGNAASAAPPAAVNRGAKSNSASRNSKSR
ncbi:MAG: hypothetical protein AB7L76_04365 [Burkholderiaceae bacterium]